MENKDLQPQQEPIQQTESESGVTAPVKRGRSIVAKGLSLSVLTFFSRILGLLREMTKAKFLGTSAFSDAFAIAFMIPNLFRRLFAENSVSVAFIPTFRTYLDTEGDPKHVKQTTQEFVSATFTLVTFLTTVFVCIGMIFTPAIIRIFFAGNSADTVAEAIILTRIMFPYLAIISIAAFFQGILNGLKIFSPSGFTPILFNAIVIAATYILSPHMANPARAMAVGVITGGSVQALFQLPFVLKNNWKVTFTSLKKSFSNPGTKKVIALVLPTIIGMAGYQVNDIISSALATRRAGIGVVSSLQYSLRLQELILGICAVTIGTVILPELTSFAKKNLWDDFTKMLSQSINIMAFIAIPVTFWCMLMGENIITLLFASGQFNSDSINQTLNVFYFHIAGLFFIAINRIISQSFYARQNTIYPTIAGLINFAVNIAAACLFTGAPIHPESAAIPLIILNKIRVALSGGKSIALALTVASIVNTIVLFIFMKKTPAINVTKIAGSTILYALKMCAFSIIACIPVYFGKDFIMNIFSGHTRLISQGVPVLISAITVAVIGIALMVITRDPLIKGIIVKIKGRKGGR